jgi:hypothetical protein
MSRLWAETPQPCTRIRRTGGVRKSVGPGSGAEKPANGEISSDAKLASAGESDTTGRCGVRRFESKIAETVEPKVSTWRREMMMRLLFSTVVLLGISLAGPARSDETQLRDRAAQALRKATDFFTGQVATEGGYLWRYSDDLARREGEGKASDTTVWVQPPGTPSVGMAFLEAYESTDDPRYLEAARQAGYCLVRGQLQSGGWDYRIYFDPKQRGRYAYRVDSELEGRHDRTRARWTTTPRRPPSGC